MGADMTSLTMEDWEEKYLPVANHLDTNASFQNEYGVGIMFETYGEELEFVLSKTGENKVWTYIDGDSGEPVIVAGYSLVNRIGYFVTENAWEDNNVSVDLEYGEN